MSRVAYEENLAGPAGTLEAVCDTRDKNVGEGNALNVEIWVKSSVDATFKVYGSKNGKDGTWRWVSEIVVTAGQDDMGNHKGFANAYRFIKVDTVASGLHEIEIVGAQ